jgi:hypothetical protein
MKTLLAVVLSSVVSTSVFANESTESWICRDTLSAADNSFALVLSQDESGKISKAELSHSKFTGTSIVSTMNFCTTQPIPAGTADFQTQVQCHDGAWTNSSKVELQLGGILPTIGSAQLFQFGPVDYVETKQFNCRAIFDN